MENTNDVLSDLKDIASGLKRIGKNRKVVLPHHKEFELIEELEGIAAGAMQNLKRRFVMSYESFTLEKDGHVANMILCRGESLNTMTRKFGWLPQFQ